MAVVGVGLGYKSYLQFGRESAYGTAVAATHKLELISEDISPQVNLFADPSIYNQRSARAYYQGGTLYKGKIKVRANYTGLMMLFDWAFGTATFGSAGGSDVVITSSVEHSFIEKAYLNSYTLEIVKGDVLTTKCFQLAGAKCSGMTITGKAGTGTAAMVTVDLDVIGKTMLTSTTPTTALNLPALLPVLFTQGTLASLKDGTADAQATYPLRIRDFEVSMQNALAEDRWFIGSSSIDEPVPSAMLTCKWKFTQEFYSVTPWARAAAGTAGELQLLFTDTVSANNLLKLHSGTAYCSAVHAPVSGYGIMTQTTEWDAAYDVTDTSALKIVNTNAIATVSTAY